MLSSLIRQFRLTPQERWPAFIAMLIATAFNALVITKYAHIFTHYSKGAWGPFMSTFHLSGFDAINYTIISQWSVFHHISVRHPLLTFILYPFHLINKLLYTITGINCVQFIYAAILIFCAVYSCIFLIRIYHKIIGVTQREAYLLAAYTFSFAYIMITICVPDHFALSLLILTITLSIAGKKETTPQQRWNTSNTFWLVFLTAGITFTNAAKTIMAACYVNRKQFFRAKYLLIAILAPILLNLLISHLQYQYIGRPAEIQREINKKLNEEKQKRLHPEKQIRKKTPPSSRPASRKGKALSNEGILKWSDVTTPRIPAAIHNLFGESIQLHQDSLLQDIGMKRPVIVKYRTPIPYIIQTIILLLFLAGAWCARRNRFLWLVTAWFIYDMIIHFGFGFALNEVYIMTAHWAFIIPIATAFLISSLNNTYRKAVNILLLLLTIYLWIYNGYLLSTFLLR